MVVAKNLTPAAQAQQDRVLKWIRHYVMLNAEAPTIAEIGDRFGLRSSATIHGILTALVKRGLIVRVPNISRGIRLVDLQAERAA